MKKPLKSRDLRGFPCLEPGSDLLWHACKAHYHRRRAFSLPSSEWDRVVPARYGRQANCLRLTQRGSRPAAPISNLGKFLVQTPCRVRDVLFDENNSIASTYKCSNHLRLYGQASRAISTG